MPTEWTQTRLEQYIADGIQESLNLEYKSAAALEKTDSKRAEITKDVAAMANSDGGIVIYGIKEYDDENLRHLPERLDPVNRTQVSKEALEQVIMTIRPKIDGLIIYPITLDSD